MTLTLDQTPLEKARERLGHAAIRFRAACEEFVSHGFVLQEFRNLERELHEAAFAFAFAEAQAQADIAHGQLGRRKS